MSCEVAQSSPEYAGKIYEKICTQISSSFWQIQCSAMQAQYHSKHIAKIDCLHIKSVTYYNSALT